MLFPETLESWDEANILRLAGAGISEPAAFDFKSAKIMREPSGIVSLSREACAFANGEGGFLVIGVEQEKGGWRVEGMAPDLEFNHRLHQRIQVEPRIRHPEARRIDLVSKPGMACYVVHFPSSSEGPHASIAETHPLFYQRSHAGATPMSWSTIRDRMVRAEERKARVHLLLFELDASFQAAARHYNVASSDYSRPYYAAWDLTSLRLAFMDLYPLMAGNQQLLQSFSEYLHRIADANSVLQAYMAAMTVNPTKQTQAIWSAQVVQVAQSVGERIRELGFHLRKHFGLPDQPYPNSLPSR